MELAGRGRLGCRVGCWGACGWGRACQHNPGQIPPQWARWENEAPATRAARRPVPGCLRCFLLRLCLLERHALAAVDPRATVRVPAPDQHPVLRDRSAIEPEEGRSLHVVQSKRAIDVPSG